METQEERRAVPGQLPLVGAVLNSHSNNKGHMGECRQRGLERYPALPFFTPSRSLNEALRTNELCLQARVAGFVQPCAYFPTDISYIPHDFMHT